MKGSPLASALLSLSVLSSPCALTLILEPRGMAWIAGGSTGFGGSSFHLPVMQECSVTVGWDKSKQQSSQLHGHKMKDLKAGVFSLIRTALRPFSLLAVDAVVLGFSGCIEPKGRKEKDAIMRARFFRHVYHCTTVNLRFGYTVQYALYINQMQIFIWLSVAHLLIHIQQPGAVTWQRKSRLGDKKKRRLCQWERELEKTTRLSNCHSWPASHS